MKENKVMRGFQSFELYAEPNGSFSKIFLDGRPVINCTAVTVRTAVNEATTITLEILNLQGVVKGKANVYMVPKKPRRGKNAKST